MKIYLCSRILFDKREDYLSDGVIFDLCEVICVTVVY